MLDALTRIGLLDEPRQVRGKEMLLRIVSMLVKLARNLEPVSGPVRSAQPDQNGNEM